MIMQSIRLAIVVLTAAFLFLIGISVGIIIGRAMMQDKEPTTGIGKSTQTQISEKESRKDRIITYLKENKEAANNDIALLRS